MNFPAIPVRTDALRDGLTGLWSRELLNVNLQQEVERWGRYGRPFSLLLLDLDYFKSINDAFGHARGDAVLVQVGQRLQQGVRAADQVYRYGGDEFVVVLPDADIEQASEVAGRVLEVISGSPVPGEPPLSVSVSIGVASFPADAETTEGLFAAADRRHYLSKGRGRGRIVWQEDAQPELPGKLSPPERLIERDAEIERLQSFLAGLGPSAGGVLQIDGPAGVGKSRFLGEAGQLGRLLGFAVLALGCTPALKVRRLGVLVEAQQAWPGWKAPQTRPALLAAAVQDWIVDKGLGGLLITIDNLEQLDPASLECITFLLQARRPYALGIIYTGAVGEAETWPETTLAEAIRLHPLSRQGVQVWLRHSLHWEAPGDFVDWLFEQTGGLPAQIEQGLKWLVAHQAIQAGAQGWGVHKAYARLSLLQALAGESGRGQRLPALAPDFTGRYAEILAIKRALARNNLVTLAGPSGVGKTRLALQVAAEVQEQYAGGVYFVSLSAADRADLLAALVRSLGESPRPREDILEQLVSLLRHKRALFVLDGMEACLDEGRLQAGACSGARLAELSSRIPETRLLVTSTTRLDLPGEVVVEVQGLPLPTQHGQPAEVHSPATELFLICARRVRADWMPLPADWPAIVRICQLMDGYPLGIELAASWISSFSCEQIAGRIEVNLSFAGGRLHSNEPLAEGQPGIQATFSSFWSLLSAAEQQAVAGLAVFRGGFSRQAVVEVCGVSLFFLDALVNKLVIRELPWGRYAMPNLLGRYAAARLRADPQLEAQMSRRHAVYFLNFLERYAEGSQRLAVVQQPETLEIFGAEIANLRAAWEWGLNEVTDRQPYSNEVIEQLVRAFPALQAFLDGRGWYHEALDVAKCMAAVLPEATPNEARVRSEEWRDFAPDEIRPRLLIRQGELCYHLGQYAEGIRVLEQALAVARQQDSQAEVVAALRMQANLHAAQGTYAAAITLLGQSLENASVLNDATTKHDLLRSLGVTWYRSGDYQRAAEFMEQALQAARQLDDPGKIAASLNNLGNAAYEVGDYGRAKALLVESLATAQALNNLTLRGAILDSLGKVNTALGEWVEAAGNFQEGLLLIQDIDAFPLVAEILTGTAELCWRCQRQALALHLAELVAHHPAALSHIRARAVRLLRQAAPGRGSVQDISGEQPVDQPGDGQPVLDVRLVIAEALSALQEVAGAPLPERSR